MGVGVGAHQPQRVGFPQQLAQKSDVISSNCFPASQLGSQARWLEMHRCPQGASRDPKETFGFRGFPRETFYIVVYPEDNASMTEEILCISGLEERSGWGLCSETSLSREANEEESTGWVLFRPSSIPYPFPGV